MNEINPNIFYEKLIDLSGIDLKDRFDRISKLEKELHLRASNDSNVPMGPGVAGGSPYTPDLRFWYLVALVLKPKRIIEIGTWIGTTTYVIAMALRDVYGDDFKIVTCDNQGIFYDDYDNELSKNIEYHHCHSNKLFSLLKTTGRKFDGIFTDAGLTQENIDDVKDLCDMSKLLFLTHDVYQTKHSKGNEAIQLLLNKYGRDFNMLSPIQQTKDWPFSEGYFSDKFPTYGINSISGLVVSDSVLNERGL